MDFTHFVINVNNAARTAMTSIDQVRMVCPVFANGYKRIDASASVRKAVSWRLNLFLSISHHSIVRIPNAVNRLMNRTNRAV